MQLPLRRLEGYSDASKIWIFTASKPIDAALAASMQDALSRFEESWNSHQVKLLSSAFAKTG